MGACIIQMLLNQSKSVQALYHNYKPLTEHKNLNWVQGDITHIKSLEGFLENSQVLIHCASLISLGKKNKNQVYNINVNGTENIIQSCLRYKVRLIHISSSTAVQEKPSNELFNEDRAYKTAIDFTYTWSKAKAEQNVLRAVKENNLDALIIRPTAIVGPSDFRPSLFGQTIWDLVTNKIPAISTGGYNIIDVRDLSQTTIRSISKGKKGEVYLVGGHYISIRDIAKLTNNKGFLPCIPVDFLIVILPLINLFSKLYPLKWPITKESLIALKYAPKKVDSSKAIKNLEHKIRPTRETIDDLIHWFKKEKIK